ncbi:MAG: glycerol kinase GlpK [Lachnospiraceae bacterium]
MGKYIMAFDAGTTSNRCIVFDRSGNIISMVQKEFTQIYSKPGWAEHNPDEIWSTQIGVAVEAMAKAGLVAEQIAAIGITNQRETTIVWERATGRPVHNAIVWQCRRTADICEELKDKKDMFFRKTGLILDPYFSATKICWILDHIPNGRERAAAGELMFGTVDTWLVYRLTGGAVHVTDYSNASRTMLFNINTLQWDKEILEFLGIPECMLPEVRSNSEIYGHTSTDFFNRPIPIGGMAGDQQAALFGQACFEKGDAKNTYGTGCFLLMNMGEEPVFSEGGLVTTIAWGIGGKVSYALEGSVFVGGASVQWLRDELGLLENAAQSEEMALKVNDTNGCYVVSAFTGLGAPYWDPYARGTIMGITRGVNKYHIVRATLNSIAFQVNDVLATMEKDLGVDLTALRVDGGASKNNYLLQTQADISNIRVERPTCVETTALGAAYLAGLAVGYWKDFDDIRRNGRIEASFAPDMDGSQRTEMISGWKKAVERAKGWAAGGKGD